MPFPKSPPVLLAFLAALAATVAGLVIFFVTKESPLEPAPPGAPAIVGSRAPQRFGYEAQPIGFPVKGNPMITNVAIADLDGDGLPDVLVCDGESNRIGWIRQSPRGQFTEYLIGDPVPGPAHVSVCDLNADGKPDLLIASMGVIMPSNDRIGSVVVLENLGGGQFRNRVLIDKIARVTDVRGADLNGDGKLDLVVGQFGYTQGEVRWMENLGDWQFKSRVLLNTAGTIHTPIADFDGDGRPDFAALVSQEAEELHLFTNTRSGAFRDAILWKGPNPSWNSSGLEICDLNRDGRTDILYSNGDGFDGAFMAPTPWHGVQWLENKGNGSFAYHRIGDMTGCYSPVAADVNGDGHLDVVSSSAFSDGNNSSSVSVMAWINDGAQNFTAAPLAHAPTHLITLAAGDIDGNGVPVLVTGGFFGFPPFNEMSRITLWRQRK